jgi:hypothetical protein
MLFASNREQPGERSALNRVMNLKCGSSLVLAAGLLILFFKYFLTKSKEAVPKTEVLEQPQGLNN